MIWVQSPSSVPQNKALCHTPKLCASKNRHNYPKNSAQAEFLSFGTRQLHKLRVFRCQNEALCHNSKQIIQEFGTSRITQKAQLFAAFVSLQGKTLFIWQIKVAKTAKAKLCATNSSSVPQNKANYPRIRHKPNSCAFAQGYW